MPKDRLRWGLLSTANINRRLIPAIRASRRAELLAVASRDQARAEGYATQWSIPRAYGSYKAMLADPSVDAVYISLPNKLHAEWAVEAARAGKHVLCEKPLALTVAECDQIIDAARASGVVAIEAVMYLHHPLLAKARELVRGGAVGEVSLVRGAFSFHLDRPGDVRLDPDLGGGALWDVGSYPVSFIRWIAGEPQEVLGWQVMSPTGVDETFVGLLRCAGGALGSFDCSFRQQFRLQAEVCGSEATLILERPYVMGTESRLVLQRGFEVDTIDLPPADPYQCEVEALTAAVLDGAALPVPLESSRANVATLTALYESARHGEAVQI